VVMGGSLWTEAGAGAGVEREVRVADGEGDGAGAGFDLPVRAGMAADLHVAGAGFREERAFGAQQVNAAAAGGGLDVVGGLQLSTDVA